MSRIRTGGAVVTLLAASIVAATAGVSQASDDEVERRGACSGTADWKIKAKPDDGRLEVEAEVDSNRNGQQWQWVLRRNGTVADRGTATTRAPSGSFSIERKTANAAGTDTFTFRAVHQPSGQVCLAQVSI